MSRTLLFLSLLATAAAVAPRAGQAAAFDGNWSVLVITNAGECDRGYRYGVTVANGKVVYNGTADINLSGTVSGAGAVSVNIHRGGQSANGSGRIGASSGSGTWRGKGPTGECSGNWEAERR